MSLFRWLKRPVTYLHQQHWEQVLGTALEVQILAQSREQALRAEQALLAEIDRLEAIFNRYNPDAELSRLLSAGPQVGWQNSSADLDAVLALAEQLHTQTQGAFNPAADALQRLWKVGQPTPKALGEVVDKMQGPLWERRHTAQGPQVRLLTPLSLNLNALAKGYIADQAALVAARSAGREVLVNLGGDLRYVATQGGRGVHVGIEAPDFVAALSDNRLPLLSIKLGQGVQLCALATSSHSHRGAHLFDPRTGQPTSPELAVTVAAATCAQADALSTALCTLSVADGLALADNLDLAALLVTPQGQFSSARWAAMS